VGYCKNCGNELPEEARFCPKCGTAVAIEEASSSSAPPLESTTPVAPCEPKFAFWLERFVAWLIDAAIIGVATSIVGLFFALPFPFNSSIVPGWPDWLPFFISFNLNSIVLFLYWMFMESVYGQSIGKMVMRIRVTRLDGSPIAVSHAALESIGKAFFLPLDVLIGWLLYPKCHQRIFNYISQTIVIKSR